MESRTIQEVKDFIRDQIANMEDVLDGIYPQEENTEYDIGACEGAIDAYNNILRFIGER